MKLYVILVGLFTIALPEQNDRPAEVLFLETGGHQTSHGLRVPRHPLRLEYLMGGREGADTTPVRMVARLKYNAADDPRGLNLRIGGNTPVEVVNKAGFVDLRDVTKSSDPVRLRPECAGEGAVAQCLVGGEPAVAAHVRLGGGKLQPVEVDLDSVFRTAEIPQAKDLWTFRTLKESSDAEGVTRATFNGALFELELPAGDERAVIEVGDSQVILQPQKLQQCLYLAEQAGADDECIVVRLDNSVDSEIVQTASSMLKVMNDTADSVLDTMNQQYGVAFQLGPRAALKLASGVDAHFELIYPLLSDSSVRPVVPHISLAYGRENPPESRCVPNTVLLP